MITTLYIFGSVLLVSFVSFAGIFAISLKKERLEQILSFIMPLAVGALFGDAFFHLIPESFENIKSPALVSFLLILGIISFFVIEKFLRWHHHTTPGKIPTQEKNTKHLGQLILFSDGLHNLLDGAIIGTSYLVSIEAGIATTLAIILHEIPEEIADFGVLIYAGYERGTALFYNFLSAFTAVLGAALIVLFGSLLASFTQGLIPFAAGAFIYIAGSDLIPELNKNEKSKSVFTEIAGISLGIFAMYLLLFLE